MRPRERSSGGSLDIPLSFCRMWRVRKCTHILPLYRIAPDDFVAGDVIRRGTSMTSTLGPRVHLAGSTDTVDGRPPDAAPTRDDWQLDAACRETDGSWFFPPERERESARLKRVAKAKTVCRQCPVLADCRAYAVRVGEPFGVWGGLSEEERPQSPDRDSKIAELDARSKVPAKRRSSRKTGQRQQARVS